MCRNVLSKVQNKDPECTEVRLPSRYLTDVLVAQLCGAMGGNSTVTALHLSYNKITDRGVATLASHITAAITYLQLSGNQIGDEGAAILSQSPTLLHLHLDSTKIGYRGVVALARNTALSTLCLQSNNVDARGAIALSANTTLRTLDLSYNDIGDCGAIALSRNTTLTVLRLYWNHIGDCGATALSHNTTLMTLRLADNKIGDDGATALACNSTLTTLALQRNYSIGIGGLSAFAQNTTLTDLYLSSLPLEYLELESDITLRAVKNCQATNALIGACLDAMRGSLAAVAKRLQEGILPYGEYIQSELNNEDTLLHLAVRLRRVDLVDLLLAHGAAADSHTVNSENMNYRQLAKSMGVQLSSAYFGKMLPYY